MAPEDSRRYTVARLRSFSGYNDSPIVDDSLTFNLPPFNRHSGRIVDQHPSNPLIPAYEVWSPNSAQRPFYPGLPPPNFQPRTLPDPSLRRFDGHLGPYDYTMNPQVLTASVWRAFILRPSFGYRKQDEYPEYRFIYKEWEVTEGRTSYGLSGGRIKLPYIAELESRLALLDSLILGCSELELTFTNFWSQRPIFPHPTAIDDLRHVAAYEDAVDLGVAIQRGLKEKAAYLIFANLVLDSKYQPAVDELVASEIPEADDRYLGAFINGDRRQDALWLLSQKVPCFLVHALTGVESWLATEPGVCNTWWEGTETAGLGPRNGYDDIALRLNSAVRPYVAAIIRAPMPSISFENRERSSSSRQGWTGETIGVHATRPPPQPREPSPMVIDPPSAAPAIHPSLAAPPVDYVIVDQDRIPWIRPPVVFDSRNLPGQWTKWQLDDHGSLQEMSKRAAKEFEPDEGGVWFYDRHLRRELYVNPSPVPKGLVSALDIFGRPAPRVAYLDPYGRQKKGSHWMYPARFDEGGRVGKTCPTPETDPDDPRLTRTNDFLVESLPLLDGRTGSIAARLPVIAPPPTSTRTSLSPATPFRAVATSLRTGAARRRRTLSKDSAEISLGSSSEPEGEIPTCYLMTSPFPVSTDWNVVREAVVALTWSLPESQILRVDRSSTASLQTLWFTLNSPEGAAALRSARSSTRVSPELGGELHWATLADLQQVQSLGGENWTRPLPSSQPLTRLPQAASPLPEPRRRAASPLASASRSRWRGRTPSPIGRRRSPSPPPFQRRRSPSPPPFRRLAPIAQRPRRPAASRHWSPPRREQSFERGRSDRSRAAPTGSMGRGASRHSETAPWTPAPASFSSPSPSPYSPLAPLWSQPPVEPLVVAPATSQVPPPLGTREHAAFMAQVLIETMTRMAAGTPADPGVAQGAALPSWWPQLGNAPPSAPEGVLPYGTLAPTASALASSLPPVAPGPMQGEPVPLTRRLNIGILERLTDGPLIDPPPNPAPHLMHRLQVGLGERIADAPVAGPSSSAGGSRGREAGEIDDAVPERRKRGRRAGRQEHAKALRRQAARDRDRERRNQRRYQDDDDSWPGSGHARGGAL
ncbi:hypothetical protein FPV67DRAFT_1683018 [Lyophyllum atratum]|nr:hypothetical protein FPV67DRAFT_1683012 [Lyophyllum atratum]KAF8054160.1 hypothetical protein FPV67DRAFT_1683018 [Lyophyllum atratum]